jgi:NitT/TauT family transport system permease protein
LTSPAETKQEVTAASKPAAHSPRVKKKSPLIDAFTPNTEVTKATQRSIAVLTALFLLLIWQFFPQTVIPRPLEVTAAIAELWRQGLAAELYVSLMVQAESILIALFASLLLADSTVLPALRPLVAFISKWRFIGLGALVVFFGQIISGAGLKILLLVLSMSVFYITSMVEVVADIPREEFDHARTLGYSQWGVVWEVVVLGKRDLALEMLRQNAAMGWMMLTMVEGLVRSGGGIGTLILNETKHFRLAHIFGIVVVLLAVGLFQDLILQFIRRQACPYADLKKARR